MAVPPLDRIRGEYREMPGMRLTPPQAERLWQIEHDDCEAALDTLVPEGFLGLTEARCAIRSESGRDSLKLIGVAISCRRARAADRSAGLGTFSSRTSFW